MVQARKVGLYSLRAKAVETPGGWLGAVIVTRSGGADCGERVVLAEHGVGRQFVFKDAQAAIRYAFDVGHRHVRGLETTA